MTIHQTAILNIQPHVGRPLARTTRADWPPTFLHETASVQAGAKLFAGVYIGAFSLVGIDAVIREGTQIGMDCVIGTGCDVGQECRFGDRVRLNSHVHITGGSTIEDDVFIAPGVVFCNDPNMLRGGYVWRPEDIKPPHIKRGAFIFTGAIIMPGVIVGECAVVSAGSLVTRDVPDGAIVKGSPAKVGDANILQTAEIMAMTEGR